ncbi:MAG: carbamoyltransferase HypF [Actinomycetota bacterium]|nr:carbamoyltransferase HypF [Actinomycetota bacterium]
MVAPDNRPTRRRLTVTGIVQGVGFRPFVYSLATDLSLSGFVGNDTDGVFVEVEGSREALDRFTSRLRSEAPPAARIATIDSSDLAPSADDSFRIVASRGATIGTALVSPDLRTCDDCLRELRDPENRRFRYPFINCTNCGPRFTITESTPYDRPNTTMAPFAMCRPCRAEYEDPADRRFHAQPNACPDCGPRVWLETASTTHAGDPIGRTRDLINAGSVVAIKGLGGFHLACDASSDEAVELLRRRKGRVGKPFALMVADVATARRVAELSDAETRLLESRERPIVLATARAGSGISDLVAPGTTSFGVMLPYTPLHTVLLQPGEVWVMTSGNRAQEPIVTRNEDARTRLGELADAFLMHDRGIHVPCDDSVTRVLNGTELPVRRSRGYTPYPVPLPFAVPPLLATGGELKATFCLASGHDGFMSQHIGDMENLETLDAFARAVEHFQDLFRIEPQLIAADLHPGYLSTRWAKREANGRSVVEVQHHHAHIASVMADNGLTEPVIGFSFDGTGYGTDGTVWGGEILLADYTTSDRVAHLAPVPLPGGDAAVLRPWRMALSHLWAAGIPWAPDLPPVAVTEPTERAVVRTQLERGLNSVDTSSMGRLFDAIASLSGVRHHVTYEAQAAIELEALVNDTATGSYRFALRTAPGPTLIDPGPVVEAVVGDVRAGIDPGTIAARFHRGVAEMMVAVANQVRERHGLATVGLSGGVFQNVTIAGAARSRLEEAGFTVATHRLVPPNDGGLALGQAVIAARGMR